MIIIDRAVLRISDSEINNKLVFIKSDKIKNQDLETRKNSYAL